ncbi:AAA family ATPase [Mesobacterium sp. TK19101]|uniref:AAA family ATPase n=1 Tax=Mesobacterium hydrothermale TaxID=3111907 RepID=A0ABU6HJX5_9RHOB|nr:AAA family ATPase [Mesobacterium sp. TK19101]MEC3862758.1 AAA family ATPase [Mesobacterium sp. TK19101]
MRYVDRTKVPPPSGLLSEDVTSARRAYLNFLSLDPRERAQTRPPTPLPTKYLEEFGVLESLVHLFDGKCAFCESTGVRLQVHRFRPEGEATPMKDNADAPLYYGWLTEAWNNLYPICDRCLPGDFRFFPVKGARVPAPTPEEYQAYIDGAEGRNAQAWPFSLKERALLLDPCKDRGFSAHWEVLPNGKLNPLTEPGKTTIGVFNLNDPALVSRRAEALAPLHAAMEDEAGFEITDDDEFAGILRQYRDNPQVAKRGAVFNSPMFTTAVPVRRMDSDWRLQSIRISGFKALETITLDLPAPPEGEEIASALLVLGENATGKSSLLEAIALTLLDHKSQKLLDLTPKAFLLNPRYMGGEFLPPRERAEVVLRFADSDGEEVLRELRVDADVMGSLGPYPTGLPVFAYGAYRHYRDSERRWRDDITVRSLFHTDFLLSNPEKWLLGLSDRRFDMVVQALRIIIGGGFTIMQRDFEAEQCLVVIEADGVSMRTPLTTVSSGFRTILALTCDMMRWLMRESGFQSLLQARGLVLIDEVEAHLHPRWKVTIMDGLRRAFPNMQFIATTHDPLCLRGMRNGEVRVLQRVPGVSADTDLPVLVETLTDLPDVTKLTVEQLLTSDLFDLFDTDDAETGRAMAELADALQANRDGKEVADARMKRLLSRFRSEVDDALPVGSTEVSRLVQDAVADYVIAREKAGAAERRRLRDATKQRIIDALGDM